MDSSRGKPLPADERATSEREAHHRVRWESNWARADFAPAWRIQSIPLELQQAVAQGWFPPAGSILDIGCGSGEIAAWLVGEGYEVVAIDFSPSALAIAEEAYRDVQGLTLQIADICEGPPERDRFDVLLDRGCLQGVPVEAKPDYVQNVAAAGKPDARFLLFHRVRPDSTREETVRNLEALFQGTFDVIRIADAEFGHDPARSPSVIRGVVFWMTQR